jgi:hypothetical protein
LLNQVGKVGIYRVFDLKRIIRGFALPRVNLLRNKSLRLPIKRVLVIKKYYLIFIWLQDRLLKKMLQGEYDNKSNYSR